MKSSLPSNYSVEDIFDLQTFLDNPALFYSAARSFASIENAKPTAVHRWLQLMQPSLQLVITQNIDSLESELSCPLIYLHGLLASGTCQNCSQKASKQTMFDHYRKGKVAYCQCGVSIERCELIQNRELSNRISCFTTSQ